jgi:hypothetical protein
MNHLAPYPRHDEIVETLRSRNAVDRLGDAILVTTDVMLPDGSQVIAVVEGGAAGDRVTASDAGAALISVGEAGLTLDTPAYASVRRLASKYGLSLEAGVLRSEPVSPEDVAYAIILLANGARDIAKASFDLARRQERLRFRERVEKDLGAIFGPAIVQRGARLSGYSEDSLRFDYLVTVSAGQRMVVDAPIPDGSSIASVVLRQADMKAARVPGMHQAIIYDEADHWRSTSLAQLKLAQVPLISARLLREGLLSAIAILEK